MQFEFRKKESSFFLQCIYPQIFDSNNVHIKLWRLSLTEFEEDRISVCFTLATENVIGKYL